MPAFLAALRERAANRLVELPGLTCRDASRLASQALDRRLSVRERLALAWHQRFCAWCHRYAQQLRMLRRWLRNDPRMELGVFLPAPAAARLKERVRLAV